MEGQCKQDQKPPRDFYLRKSVFASCFLGFQFSCAVSLIFSLYFSFFFVSIYFVFVLFFSRWQLKGTASTIRYYQWLLSPKGICRVLSTHIFVFSFSLVIFPSHSQDSVFLSLSLSLSPLCSNLFSVCIGSEKVLLFSIIYITYIWEVRLERNISFEGILGGPSWFLE